MSALDHFHHEALFYAGDDEFCAGASAFCREGVEADEPILVVVSAAKIERLRESLGGDATSVHFADMDEVGANPARIIPAWRDFVSAHAHPGRPLRGIGEPICASRGPAELVECQRHESLLNLAFADAAGFRLLCPYDTEALDPDVIVEARRSHPFVVEQGVGRQSGDYRGLDALAAPFEHALPDPPAQSDELSFDVDTLPDIRRRVSALAAGAGITGARGEDLVVAVNEIATNSVRHAGGGGILRTWNDSETLICEVTDAGRIDQPLVGRERPTARQLGGRGFWLAHQICDLVQIRSLADGSVVRLHMRRD